MFSEKKIFQKASDTVLLKTLKISIAWNESTLG